MFRIVVCEDENIFRSFLVEAISDVFIEKSIDLEIMEYSSGEALFDNYPENIDIFFLDIEMNKLSGMDVAKKLREHDTNVEIIFTTAVSGYLEQGYEVRAYRYLIKPFEKDDLKRHLLACISDILSKRENYLVLEGKGILYKIDIDNITYIEVLQRNITVHTLDDKYTIKMSISNIEKKLKNYNFYRSHRSYLINLKYVQSISSNMAIVNNDEVPISRYRIENFKLKLVNTLGATLC
ncbi:LytR/AlgR family response regulator transcription factor [Romboutsia sp.]|uniref:LytR/AlgR family response regulator transcription factor n=1 Tax=Romboutsia sp. TaxID=1965302 RepID=UPI003F3CF59F